MTVIVGVRCIDGVVIGADSRATSSHGASPLVSLETASKIKICGDAVIVAGTGAVGYSQRLSHHVEEAIKGNVFKNLNENDCVTNISKRLLTDFSNTFVQRKGSSGVGFGALVAAVIKGVPTLVEFDTVEFQPEIKRPGDNFFVSIGSGQVLADPFLAFVSRVLWKNSTPTVGDARFGVYWVLDHTIKLAAYGVGGPIKIATISNKDTTWVCDILTDTQEQSEYIAELEASLGSFARKGLSEGPSDPLPTPPPAVANGVAS